MNPELQNWQKAREILSAAYLKTIGMGAAHEKVWRSIEYVDRQSEFLMQSALTEPDSAAKGVR